MEWQRVHAIITKSQEIIGGSGRQSAVGELWQWGRYPLLLEPWGWGGQGSAEREGRVDAVCGGQGDQRHGHGGAREGDPAVGQLERGLLVDVGEELLQRALAVLVPGHLGREGDEGVDLEEREVWGVAPLLGEVLRDEADGFVRAEGQLQPGVLAGARHVLARVVVPREQRHRHLHGACGPLVVGGDRRVGGRVGDLRALEVQGPFQHGRIGDDGVRARQRLERRWQASEGRRVGWRKSAAGVGAKLRCGGTQSRRGGDGRRRSSSSIRRR